MIPSSPMPPMIEWFGKEYVDPFHAGAAVAFGLMGMAEAIRSMARDCSVCGHTHATNGQHDWGYDPRGSD